MKYLGIFRLSGRQFLGTNPKLQGISNFQRPGSKICLMWDSRCLPIHRYYSVCCTRTNIECYVLPKDYDQRYNSETFSSLQKNQFSFTRPSIGGRAYSTNTNKEVEEPKEETSDGIIKRFKDAYKKNGKVLVGVHLVTSSVWYGSFVYAASCGVDVVPLLEYLGASETIIKPFQSSGAGNLAVAYLMYKLATPARYFVTIGGTQIAVNKLRQWGYMEQRAEEDTLRSLMKDSKNQIKTKISDKKDDLKDKVEDMKDDLKDRVDDLKDDLKDKVIDMKGDLKGKVRDARGDIKQKIESGEWKEKMGDLRGDIHGKIKKMELKEKVGDLRGELQDKFKNVDLKDKAKEFKDSAKDIKESMKERYEDAKDKYEDYRDDRKFKR